jgi:hypothetical protein
MEMVCRDMETTGNYLAPSETMVGNKACHAVSIERLGDSAPEADAQPAPVSQARSAEPMSTAAAGAPTSQDIYAPPVMPKGDLVDNSIRVFVTDSESWDTRGGWGGNQEKSSSSSANETAKEQANIASEVEKLVTEVNRQCPQVVITSDVSRAAFAVTLAHEGKNRMSERNKIVVFNHGGDDIYSAATRGLGDSLGDACHAILSSAKP